MNEVPLISVVMPVRDGAATLGKAIESILHQDCSEWELLIVDDGSADDSARIAQTFAEERIRVLKQNALGIAPALNAGIAAARGQFIARMDADDVSLPSRLRLQSEYLLQHPETGLVSCCVQFGGDADMAKGYSHFVKWTNQLLSHEQIFLNRFVESPLAHPSVMFRRSLVKEFGGYAQGNFPEDYELWLRWLEAGVHMHKQSESLLIWNDRPERLSRTHAAYAPEAFYALKAEYLSRWLRSHAQANARPVYIWGAGRVTRQRVQFLLDRGIQHEAWIDIDPRKIGQVVAGAEVIGMEMLPPPEEAFVVGYVASRGARELIRAALVARGFVEGTDFIFAA